MKKLLCVLFVLITATAIVAQPGEPRAMNGEQKRIGDFTVLLKPAPGNSFLFDIIKQDGLPPGFLRNPNNPVTMLPGGFTSKEEAYKVAEWMIGQYKKHGHFPSIVPPHIARGLNIAVDKLYNQP